MRGAPWTPELIEELRQHAAAGVTKQQAAQKMGRSLGAIDAQAFLHKIGFSGKSYDNCEVRPPAPPDPAFIAQKAQAAREQLRRECALARAEAATAPLYRGGWP
jgi:hypothetical protein